MYNISEGTKEETDIIRHGLIEYNSNKLPFHGNVPFETFNRVMKDMNGIIIAGTICEISYYWNTLYIEMLWVKDEFRNKGCGSKLLCDIENFASEQGCNLVHLETMDFQAKDFYIKNGYEVFGELENVPADHTRYYMKKSV